MLNRLRNYLNQRHADKLLQQFGGIQQCPWCRQIAQSGESWNFRYWSKDPLLDVLTCGVCGGTSLWRFELGMMWIGPLDPPKPCHPPVDYYNIESAKLGVVDKPA